MRTPWHVWLVGLVSLLWNAGGAFDYLMTQMGVESYLAMLTEPQRAFMDQRPVWFDAAWAVGVWCSVAGSLLILLRSRLAAPLFLLSIIGLLVSAVWSFGVASPSATEVMGSFSLWFSLLVCATLIGFWVYARAMAARGILR